jgi:cytochrome b561
MPMTTSLQISADIGIYNERLAIALGLLTLVFALAILASCRSFAFLLNRFGVKDYTNNKPYQSFYKFHSYYWWIFWLAFVLHLMTAVTHTELPAVGDPDAGIHWLILGFGAAALVSMLIVSLSCRSIIAFSNIFTEKSLLKFKIYNSFYRYHSYYWFVFILLIAGHFTSAYIHAGIWPGSG